MVRPSRGHFYSIYPVAGPALSAPLYLPTLLLPARWLQNPETMVAIARIAEKFVAVALAALCAVWMLMLLERMVSRPWAWGLTLEGPGNGWMWLCGAAAGVAFMIRPTNALLLPAVVVALHVRRAGIREYARFLGPVVLAGAFTLIYNWGAFRDVFGGYPGHMDGRFGRGVAGVLISPSRGLFVYTPVALFALAAFLPAARDNRGKHRSLLIVAAIFAVLHTLFMAKWSIWWGGFSWGPRLLTEIAPCLVILIAIGVPAIEQRNLRALFVTAAVYSCLIQALGAYCYPKGRWDQSPVDINIEQTRLWDWVDNPIARTARGGLAWEPYAIVGTALTEGFPAAARKLHEYGINAY